MEKGLLFYTGSGWQLCTNKQTKNAKNNLKFKINMLIRYICSIIIYCSKAY